MPISCQQLSASRWWGWIRRTRFASGLWREPMELYGSVFCSSSWIWIHKLHAIQIVQSLPQVTSPLYDRRLMQHKGLHLGHTCVKQSLRTPSSQGRFQRACSSRTKSGAAPRSLTASFNTAGPTDDARALSMEQLLHKVRFYQVLVWRT